jgi:hypothetical protein
MSLTDEQVRQPRDADFISIERHLALTDQLDRLHLQIEKAFSAETLDEAAVLETAQTSQTR